MILGSGVGCGGMARPEPVPNAVHMQLPPD